MKESLIQLPDVTEIKELLTMARRDIKTEMDESPDAADSGKLLMKVLDVLDEKVGKQKDLSKLSEKEEIDLAAHLNFLHCLLEDFFASEEDFDEDEFDDEEYDDEEYEDLSDFEEEE